MKRTVFPTNALPRPGINMQNNEIWPLPPSIYKKINSKWTKNWNVRAKTINLLEESKGVNLYDLGLSNGFLNMTPKQTKKEKYR